MKPSRRAILGASAAILAALAAASPASRWARSQMMTRRALATFVRLLDAANAQDVPAARSLCTARYASRNPPVTSPGGGLVGLPRNIHRNFQAWRDGGEVYLCPTDRVGPIYRFVLDGQSWKFDGPAGMLRPGGRVEWAGEAAEIP